MVMVGKLVMMLAIISNSETTVGGDGMTQCYLAPISLGFFLLLD